MTEDRLEALSYIPRVVGAVPGDDSAAFHFGQKSEVDVSRDSKP